ncbi:response regulator [Bradyrhizobium sp. STM 3566]|uniref:response regulator n=1 Tax=Bradyrhizobium sp. STM 3566 TaxID=578928 RepID=UPI003890F066
MPEMSGFDVYFELSKLGKKILTVLITAYPTENDRSRARDAGIVRYLVKPFAEICLKEFISPCRALGNNSPDQRRDPLWFRRRDKSGHPRLPCRQRRRFFSASSCCVTPLLRR